MHGNVSLSEETVKNLQSQQLLGSGRGGQTGSHGFCQSVDKPAPNEIPQFLDRNRVQIHYLEERIEVLAVRLENVLQPSLPRQEKVTQPTRPNPQTVVGQILDDHNAQLSVAIAQIEDLTNRLAL